MSSRGILSVALAIMLILAAGLAAGAVSSAPMMKAAQGKTLTRYHDPVIVSTSLLRETTDRRTDRYRLYRALSNELTAIPFQFDQRARDGSLVLSGSETEGDWVFDDNDELVFMAKDTGDRIDRSALPADIDGAWEIEVTDPVSGQEGWAYLLHFSAAVPPRSAVSYVHFNALSSRAESTLYTLQYYPGRSFFTGLSISSSDGGFGENILDRMKIRIRPKFSLLLASWSPLFTEEDFSVKLDGVKNGPVRAIRRVRQSLDLGKFFPQMPGGTVYTYYYFSSFMTPSKFKIPWMVLKALRGFQFSGVNDFRSNAIGMTYWDGANPEGLRYTGHNEAEVNTSQDHDWWAVSGAAGTCFHVFVIPEQWKEWGISRGTVFQDDSSAVDEEGSESEVGSHTAGYSLLNMTHIRHSGEYDMNLAVVVSPDPYHPGDETQVVDMLRRPLGVLVRPIAGARTTDAANDAAEDEDSPEAESVQLSRNLADPK